MKKTTVALTVLIAITLVHQITSSQKLFVGRILSTVTEQQKEAFNKEWEAKFKALDDVYNKEAQAQFEAYDKKKSDFYSYILGLKDKEKTGLPYDFTPAPTVDQRTACYRESLLTKRSAEANEKYFKALVEEEWAASHAESKLDSTNPYRVDQATIVSVDRIFRFRKPSIESLYNARKQIILNSCENSTSGSQAPVLNEELKKLEENFNKDTAKLTKDLSDLITFCNSDQTLIKKTTDIFVEIQKKVQQKFDQAKSSLQSGSAPQNQPNNCEERLKTLEKEKTGEIQKFDAFVKAKRDLLQKQQQEQSQGILPRPTDEQVLLRTKLMSDIYQKLVEKKTILNGILSTDIAKVTNQIDSELVSWKASLSDQLNSSQKKEFLICREVHGIRELKAERDEITKKRHEKYQNDKKEIENQKTLAWNALNGPPNSTAV